MKKKPTTRQRKAADLVVANGGNITRAMLEAGYSPNTANTPGKLTNSASWKELMEAYLPDDMLLRALSEDIEAKKGNRTAELTLATKLKGRLTEKQDITSNGETITPVLVQFLNEPKDNTDTSGV